MSCPRMTVSVREFGFKINERHSAKLMSKKLGKVFLFLALLLIGCSKESANPIVARWDNQQITLSEFRLAYLDLLKQPQQFDSPDKRQAFLDELINRRLLATEAERRGLTHDERLQLHLQAREDKALRDAHYRKIIEPQIKYSEQDVAEVFAFMNEQRHLRHLFFETQEEAEAAYQELQAGAKFDDIAREVFKHSQLAESGGDLDWVDWDQMELEMANTVFRQPVKVVSAPLQSHFGWHLLEALDYRRQVILSETDFQIHRARYENLLRSKIGDQIAGRYIADMMKQVKLQAYPAAMRLVGEKLQEAIVDKTQSQPKLSVLQNFRAEEINNIEDALWDRRNEPLMLIDGQPLSIGRFAAALVYVPRDLTRKSFKTALDVVIRDAVLTREAKEMELENEPAVKNDVRLYRDDQLQRKLKAQILSCIDLKTAEVENEWKRVASVNQNPKIDTLSEQTLRADLLRQKRIAAVPHLLDSLRAKYEIIKDMKPINEFYEKK